MCLGSVVQHVVGGLAIDRWLREMGNGFKTTTQNKPSQWRLTLRSGAPGWRSLATSCACAAATVRLAQSRRRALRQMRAPVPPAVGVQPLALLPLLLPLGRLRQRHTGRRRRTRQRPQRRCTSCGCAAGSPRPGQLLPSPRSRHQPRRDPPPGACWQQQLLPTGRGWALAHPPSQRRRRRLMGRAGPWLQLPPTALHLLPPHLPQQPPTRRCSQPQPGSICSSSPQTLRLLAARPAGVLGRGRETVERRGCRQHIGCKGLLKSRLNAASKARTVARIC